jgi:hypothetical protein
MWAWEVARWTARHGSYGFACNRGAGSLLPPIDSVSNFSKIVLQLVQGDDHRLANRLRSGIPTVLSWSRKRTEHVRGVALQGSERVKEHGIIGRIGGEGLNVRVVHRTGRG